MTIPTPLTGKGIGNPVMEIFMVRGGGGIAFAICNCCNATIEKVSDDVTGQQDKNYGSHRCSEGP